MATFRLKDIQSNPFRHMDRYPISRVKVDSLKESINSTTFWENVVARKTKDGCAELAYGHHRLIALRELYGDKHEINLIIKPLSDEMMLQMMARENLTEWGSNVAVEHETVRAVVQAYAEGRIALPKSGIVDGKAGGRLHLRYAPSFIVGNQLDQGRIEKPYTIQAVADFLGWNKGKSASIKVAMAIRALEYIELGLLREKDFEDVSPKDARAIIEETSKAAEARLAIARSKEQEAREAEKRAKQATTDAQREASIRRAEAARKAAREKEDEAKREAKRVGRDVAEKLQRGEIGYLKAKQHAQKVDPHRPKEKKHPPRLEDLSERIAGKIGCHLDPNDDQKTVETLEILVEHREALTASSRTNLIRTLNRLAQRARTFAQNLDDSRVTNGHAQLGR